MTDPNPGPNSSAPPLEFNYLNHAGQMATRHVIPGKVWFGTTKWHTEPQYLLRAWDLDRGAERDFALRDVTFGDPAKLRFNPNLRRGFATIALGIITLVLVLIGVLTVIKTYSPAVPFQ